MVSSITGSQSSGILGALSTGQTTPSGSTDSFTKQLAAVLEGYLGQSRNNSHLQIDIQTTPSQNTGVRQFLVTVKDPESTPAQTGSPATQDPESTPAQPASTAAAVASANAPQASAVSTGNESPAGPPRTPTELLNAEMDAYWAAQPPEVQQLRNIMDFNARMSLASELAGKGYAIDKGIMVWHYDPLKTMAARQIYGYTWVPTFNSNLNSPPPGFALPGQTPYDPANPPAGSIKVSTAFADGLGITDPFAL